MFTANHLCGQETNYLFPENRKGQVFFKIGSEYRITPLPYAEGITIPEQAVDIDFQNSGVAFFYSLDFFITKNLNVGFSNSFRYDYLGSDLNQLPNDFGAKPADRGLIIGYHFYLDYHFKIFKESEIFIRIGKSLLNRGTNIRYKETFFDTDGNSQGILFSSRDYSFEPTNIGLGWKKNKIEILIGAYISNNTEYFVEQEELIIPYFKFSYNLGRL